MKTAIFLMGPTASGKTGAAIHLAGEFPVDIISVDSGMVYRDMDIGTAKPTLEEQKKAPHQLIDICDPAQPYSAAKFRDDALVAIEQAFQKNRIPLLVGGTMLYFHLLQHGLAELPKANDQLREKMLDQGRRLGWQSLHDELKAVDPVSAAQIHPNDPQRIQRALEVYWATGRSRTEIWAESRQSIVLPFKILPIVLAPLDRSILHRRIEHRFHQMLEQGFLAEVESLYQRGDLREEFPSVRAVGYRQAWQYFSGICSKEEMTELSIIATRQLAKRQLTWLRRWEEAVWINSDDADHLDQIMSLILKNFC